MRRFITSLVIRHNRGAALWLKLGRPSPDEWSEYHRRWGGFRHFGRHSKLTPGAIVSDPPLTWIGDNVVLSACSIVCHDGSATVMARAYDVVLDAVGPVVILDNVFIGVGAIVLPNVRIGPNAIVAAGAVVTEDVPEDAVVAGVPAHVVGSVSELVRRREAETRTLPWYELLRRRGSSFTAADPIERALRDQRVAHFFGTDQDRGS